MGTGLTVTLSAAVPCVSIVSFEAHGKPEPVTPFKVCNLKGLVLVSEAGEAKV